MIVLRADCLTAMGDSQTDGVYLIRPPGDASSGGPSTLRVHCQRDQSDRSTVWTLIQSRSDGHLSFARGWEDYRVGFGDPASSEYWLGNDNIARLTSSSQRFDSAAPVPAYRLRIDMWDIRGQYWVAEYSSFRIGGPDDLYRLELADTRTDAFSAEKSVDITGGLTDDTGRGGDSRRTVGFSATGGFHGNATDALRESNHQPFSTIDNDNDVSTTDCAKFYAAGWWYKHCHYANLNGR